MRSYTNEAKVQPKQNGLIQLMHFSTKWMLCGESWAEKVVKSMPFVLYISTYFGDKQLISCTKHAIYLFIKLHKCNFGN